MITVMQQWHSSQVNKDKMLHARKLMQKRYCSWQEPLLAAGFVVQNDSSSLCMLTSAMIPTFQELRKVFRSKLWQATFWPTFAMINHSLPVQCGAFAAGWHLWRTSHYSGEQQFNLCCSRCHHKWPHGFRQQAASWLFAVFQIADLENVGYVGLKAL